jgi:hypothetical protein
VFGEAPTSAFSIPYNFIVFIPNILPSNLLKGCVMTITASVFPSGTQAVYKSSPSFSVPGNKPEISQKERKGINIIKTEKKTK